MVALIVSVAVLSQAQSKVTCPSCNGTKTSIERCAHCHNGAVLCNSCNGRGFTNDKCGSCGGRGEVSRSEKTLCRNCNGQKYFRENRPVSCTCRGGKRPMTTRGGNVTYVDCSRCGGKGVIDNYVNVACRQCGASGYAGSHTVSAPCSACNGSGSKSTSCAQCSGHGSYACTSCGGYARMRVECGTCRGEGYIYVKD